MWEEDGRLTRIDMSIVVEKDGQKAILIGKGGSMLNLIGSEARLEIEDIIGSRVHLQLFVKVREDWRQNPRMLRDLEYLGDD
jgi:GTP-binding protein Era